MKWRRYLRVLLDLFPSRDRRRRDSEIKNTKTLEEGKPPQEPRMQKSGRRETRVQILGGETILGDSANPCNSSFDTDLEDDVFVRYEGGRATGESSKMSMDDKVTKRNSSDHNASTISLPVKIRPPIARVSSSYQPHRTRRLRSPRGSVSMSESLLNENYPSVSIEDPATPTQRFLSTNMETSENSPRPETSGRKHRCRGRSTNTSHIKVKYTKVYGEEDEAYRNDSVPRGLVFMCNFSKFKDKKYSERFGSEHDYENLMCLFQQMGYGHRSRKQRYCHTGYITKKDFLDRLEAFSRDKNHQVLCSCVIIIMSHGTGPKSFVTSDNQEIDLLDVYRIFDNINCEVLRGKPKIFVLQFCRNVCQISRPLESTPMVDEDRLRRIVKEEVQKLYSNVQPHHQHSYQDSTDSINPPTPRFLDVEEITRQTSLASLSSIREAGASKDTERAEQQELQVEEFRGYHVDTRNLPQIPQEGVQRYSDMYSIFSTSPGEQSYRDPRKGSLLIQAICHVFAEYAYHHEIDTLVRKVSTYMTKTLQKDDPITVPRQTCERTNNGLDKEFYFNPHELPTCRHVTI